MGVCQGCASERDVGDLYCPTCGIGARGLGAVVALLPAALTGAVAALIALAISRAMPVPQGSGFLHSTTMLVLTTTFPHFDVSLALVAGAASAFALAERDARSVALVGAVSALLFVVASLGVGLAHHASPNPTRLLVALALGPVGGLLALGIASRGGRVAQAGALLRRMPGGRYVGTGFASLVAVAMLMVLYGVAVVALMVAIAIALVGVAIWVALRLIGGGGAPKLVTRNASGDIVSTSEKETTFFGNDAGLVTRDADGKVIARSENEKTFFGNDAGLVTRDPDGKVVARSENEKTFFGNDAGLVTRDPDGKVVARSEKETSFFGYDLGTVTRDADGNIIGRTTKE